MFTHKLVINVSNNSVIWHALQTIWNIQDKKSGIQVQTYSSIALFHMITYPERMKDSIFTICVFPLSVPT